MNETEYREQLNRLEEELSDVYRRRRALLEEFADDHEPILPPPRYRTEHQARIARCPRCGGSLSEGPVEKATRERYEKLVDEIAAEPDSDEPSAKI